MDTKDKIADAISKVLEKNQFVHCQKHLLGQ